MLVRTHTKQRSSYVVCGIDGVSRSVDAFEFKYGLVSFKERGEAWMVRGFCKLE